MVLRSAALAVPLLMLAGVAQAAPNIPANELAGRERERFFDRPLPETPRIELQDGRPNAVIGKPDQRKKRRDRGSRRR